MARNGKRRLLAEMNVVPYIDVMLVLVVILMVAAPYVNPSIVDLPKVNKRLALRIKLSKSLSRQTANSRSAIPQEINSG